MASRSAVWPSAAQVALSAALDGSQEAPLGFLGQPITSNWPVSLAPVDLASSSAKLVAGPLGPSAVVLRRDLVPTQARGP